MSDQDLEADVLGEAAFIAQRLRELLTGAAALLEPGEPSEGAVEGARHTVRESCGAAAELTDLLERAVAWRREQARGLDAQAGKHISTRGG